MIGLMYHDVVEPGAEASSGFSIPGSELYKLSPALFGAHLDAIAATGRDVGTVLDLFAAAPREPDVLITFDDGGGSAAGAIADALEARGFRGHVMVTTDYIGTPGFVTAAEIRDLRRRGHVIGSHSCSHPLRMSSCSREQLDDEWRRSVDVLSGILGERVTVASIPGGWGSRPVHEAAAAAGIRALFTSEPVARRAEVDGCRLIGRYTIQRSTSAEVAAAIAEGRLGPRARQLVLWKLKAVAKGVGGAHYVRIRNAILGDGRPAATTPDTQAEAPHSTPPPSAA